MNSRHTICLSVALVVLCLGASTALASWPTDGQAVCTATRLQQYQSCIPDGDGGSIIVWLDNRGGAYTYAVYAQRISGAGDILWTSDGVTAGDSWYSESNQQVPAIAVDGAGGVIVAWLEAASEYKVRVQRLGHETGSKQWGSNGVVINSLDVGVGGIGIASDGNGGAIVSWIDNRNSNTDVFAQKVNASGTAQWAANGVAICDAAEAQNKPEIASDGSGGAIITWQDGRYSLSIFARRVNSSGSPLWTDDGERVFASGNGQDDPEIVADGNGGAIIACQDGGDIYAQRMNSDGSRAWGTDGVLICNASNDQEEPQIASDGSSGAIIAWRDSRRDQYSTAADLYAQRIASNGTVQWATNGIAICVPSTHVDLYDPAIVSDDDGGALITWADYRNNNYNIYAQWVNADGEVLYSTNGTSLCAAALEQRSPVIAAVSPKAAIVAWHDLRNTGSSGQDIYANTVYLPSPLVSDPNGGEMWAAGTEHTIEWSLSAGSPALEPDYFKVGYYIGSTYTSLNDNVSHDATEYTWNISAGQTESGEYKASVIAVFGEYYETADASDADFTIYQQQTEWAVDGEPVCTATGIQEGVCLISDGDGGSIAAWVDRRGGENHYAVYAQKLDADGNALWATNGVVIRSDVHLYYNYYIRDLSMASDGEGGAIIAWADVRDYTTGLWDIYAQRVGADGTTKWTANGVQISSMSYEDASAIVVPDQVGGAIIAWNNETWGEMHVQRISGGGAKLWAENGIMITNASDHYFGVACLADGAGGAYLAWVETNTGHTEGNIYAQRVSPAGALQWSGSPWGVPICTAANWQYALKLVSDGSGGAIAAWYDNRDGIDYYFDIYAQRINPDGQVQWTANGVEAASLNYFDLYDFDDTGITADGLGGAFITWATRSSYQDPADVYAQRINGSGQKVWASSGVAICGNSGVGGGFPRIALSGAEEALILWKDLRNNGESDIYGQKIDGDGDVVWSANGLPLCTAINGQGTPALTVGGVFAWADARNGNFDIYAQQVETSSEPAIPPCTITYQFWDRTDFQIYDPDDPYHTPFLAACPKGDSAGFNDYLVVHVDFDDAYMTGTVAASEITIDKPVNLPIKFYCNGVICADSAATEANGYETTITVKAIGGGNDGCLTCTCSPPCSPPCSPSDIAVRLNGDIVGMVEDFRVRGYDLTNDGSVNLSDMPTFGSSYNKNYPDPAFNPCCDFNGDNKCNLSDFSQFGGHYNHTHESGSYYMVAGRQLRSDMDVALRIEPASTNDAAGTVRAHVVLENALNLSAAAIGFDISKASLSLIGWVPAAGFDGTVMVAPQGDEQGILLVSILGMEKLESSSAEIGTLVFAAENGGTDVTEESVSIAFGDVLDTNGRIMTIRSLEIEQGKAPLRNVLGANYPNPFNPLTTIEYSIADDSPVNLSIYNVNGQLVRTLVNEFQKSDRYSVVWDGKDNAGGSVGSGIYFYRIVAGSFDQSKKLILLR